MSDLTAQTKRKCPDDGECHHRCEGACFRVVCCNCLTSHGDEWSAEEYRDELRKADAQAETIAAKAEKLAECLDWYREQARLARLIHSEGDSGRHALARDGGKKATAALAAFRGESG